MWKVVGKILFRCSATFAIRRMILIMFGADIGRNVKVYRTVDIYDPRMLLIKDGSAVGPNVELYSCDKIVIGANVTVSQRSWLCCGTHDIYERYRSATNFMKLVSAPINIGDGAWIGGGAFVAPGVDIGMKAVVYAKSCVVKSVNMGEVVGGNPAKLIKDLKNV